MQKSLAIAVVLGASIIAAALLYHGQQLAEVSIRLAAMEKRTNGLDKRLGQFSDELPHLVEKAGNNAGRQAVHGIVDEVAHLPSKLLGRSRSSATGSKNAPSSSPGQSNNLTEDQELPPLQLDIRDPVINISILPNLKEVPAIPWPMPFSKEPQPSPDSSADRKSEVEPEASGARN